MFVSLLLANNVLHLHDIITYIIRPVVATQISDPPHYSTTANNAIDFLNALILHLFLSDHDSAESAAAVSGPSSGPPGCGPAAMVLPQFVQHCLGAKCRDLSLGYMLMLLKDLVKIRTGASLKSESLLVHSNSSASELGLSKVSVCVCVCVCVVFVMLWPVSCGSAKVKWLCVFVKR